MEFYVNEFTCILMLNNILIYSYYPTFVFICVGDKIFQNLQFTLDNFSSFNLSLVITILLKIITIKKNLIQFIIAPIAHIILYKI